MQTQLLESMRGLQPEQARAENDGPSAAVLLGVGPDLHRVVSCAQDEHAGQVVPGQCRADWATPYSKHKFVVFERLAGA